MKAESVLGRRTAHILGAIALVAVVITALFLLLHWYIDPTDPLERKDLVSTLAQILGGVALLSGLYFTWRTLQVNREGQITERFTRAIDQLGRPEREVRIGGIHALARIADNSADPHYWPVIEVLTAYVRANAPWLPSEATKSDKDPKHEEELKAEAERSHQHRQLDIQAILYILRDRKYHYGNGEDKYIWLTHTDLRNGDLREAHLERARLRGANLQKARLNNAHLWRTRLRNVNLEEAYLEEADLRGADLEEAILHKAHLQRAKLGPMRTDKKVHRTHLIRADLHGANLQGADLRGADLRGADLRGADLRAYRKKDEHTQEFIETQPANLGGADLSRANLERAIVTQEQSDYAKSVEGATMPDGTLHD